MEAYFEGKAYSTRIYKSMHAQYFTLLLPVLAGDEIGEKVGRSKARRQEQRFDCCCFPISQRVYL